MTYSVPGTLPSTFIHNSPVNFMRQVLSPHAADENLADVVPLLVLSFSVCALKGRAT